jgi:flagellar hook protein FlgE
MIRLNGFPGKVFAIAFVLLLSFNQLPAALRALSPTNVFEFSNSFGIYSPNIPTLTTNLGNPWTPSPPDSEGISRTGVETDLAIRGSGWFAVRVPDRDDMLYTRAGDFRLDVEGYLITNHGHRVQGYNTPDLNAVGDIQIDDRFRPSTTQASATITVIAISRDGNVIVHMSDGTEYPRAQILLQNFAAPDKLDRIEYHLFASTPAAQPAGLSAAPGSAGLGIIVAGALDTTPLPALLKPLPSADHANPLIEGVAVITGNGTDLAIRGKGCFLVRDPVTSELFATRAGAFLVDSNQFLITYDRKRVQGSADLSTTNIGDVRIDMSLAPPIFNSAATIYTFSFYPDGNVWALLDDGSEFVSARVLLWDFHHPDRLSPISLGQFTNVAAAQPFVITKFGGFGRDMSRIAACALELINMPAGLLNLRRHLSFFTQGAIVRTDVPTDLAIDGYGFFRLKHPRSGQQYVTRRGDFRLDANGYLVTAHGFRVQGYSNPAWTEVGDLQIDRQGAPATTSPTARMVTLSITRDGLLVVHMSDGTDFCRGQVLLQKFRESFLLRPIGNGLYANLAAAVPLDLAAAGTHGLGIIESSALELPTEREQLTLPERDGFRLGITGEPGSKWTIQATEDFASWKTIGTITNAAFESEFCDREAKFHPRRFYRVLAEYPVYVPRTYSGPTNVLPVDFNFSSSGIPGFATELQGRNPHRPIYHRARR